MIYQVFAVLAACLCFSLLASRFLSTGLRVKRSLPETCLAGEEVHYSIFVFNQAKKSDRGVLYREVVQQSLPSYAEFRRSREQDEEKRNIFDRKMLYYRWMWLVRQKMRMQSAEQPLPEIGGGGRVRTKAVLKPLRRGIVHFKGYGLIKVDPLGLCKRERVHLEGGKILVLPKLYQVPPLSFAGSRRYHLGGMTAARDRGDTNEFASLREYVPGDPVKYIDWKSTARLERPIVKQFRDEYFSRYALVLDSFTEKSFSGEFEEAVSVAASILMGQDSFNAVLDLLFVEQECITCSIGAGLEGRRRMLEILASVQAAAEDTFHKLAGLVKSHCSLLSGIVLILVDLDEQRRELVDYLVARRIATRVIVVKESGGKDDVKKLSGSLQVPVTVVEPGKVETTLAQL